MHCHHGTNNKAPRWTFTDPYKPEVRPGAREESASPAWLATPAMIACDTTKVNLLRLDTGCGLTLYRKSHSHNTPVKGIIALESNPSRGTVLPVPQVKGNKCAKNVKYERTDALSLWHQQLRTKSRKEVLYHKRRYLFLTNEWFDWQHDISFWGLWLTYYDNIGGQLWSWRGDAEPNPTMSITDSL